MDRVAALFAVLALLAATLASIAIWSPRRLAPKLVALAAAAAFMPAAYASVTELLSRPKPVSLEWAQRTAPQARVLGAKVVEGQAIFVFLELPDASEPRAYRLPWRRELAEQLQGAQQDAEERGGGVVMELPFDGKRYEASLDEREPVFHAPAPEALPDKEVPQTTTLYERGR
jgi:hypothetical protein